MEGGNEGFEVGEDRGVAGAVFGFQALGIVRCWAVGSYTGVGEEYLESCDVKNQTTVVARYGGALVQVGNLR